MKGYIVALLEVLMFSVIATAVRTLLPALGTCGLVMYYWFTFTVLTGYWESVYVRNYDYVSDYADTLLVNKESVWTKDYPWYYIRPDLMARIFYAEYGASADREYMSKRKGDYWSRLIESSHALCCATLCLAALIATDVDAERSIRLGMVGMGMQFMNSLLYMGQYFLECRDKDSVNYADPAFPLGKWMINRWFMWVNAFWMLFPTIIIWQYC